MIKVVYCQSVAKLIALSIHYTHLSVATSHTGVCVCVLLQEDKFSEVTMTNIGPGVDYVSVNYTLYFV